METATQTETKKFLFGYTESNPLKVDNYPYGFKLRTTIMYWIETVAKKGDRFCSQTINPKNGRLNAPKKSTFSHIGIMYQDEKGHTHWTGVGIYTDRPKIEAFIKAIGGVEMLNPLQKTMYNSLLGINEVKHDEFTGEKKKDFSVKWERETIGAGWKDGKYNSGEKGKCDEVKITFDRPDGVTRREVFEAMRTLNQEKLNEVFEVRTGGHFGDRAGTVRICTRGGNQLLTVSEESYKNYLASDEIANKDN